MKDYQIHILSILDLLEKGKVIRAYLELQKLLKKNVIDLKEK